MTNPRIERMTPVEIGVERTFDAAHRLAFHEGACCNLHGHTYRAMLSVTGYPDRDGLVLDFSTLNQLLENVLRSWDHTVILSSEDRLVKILRAIGPELCIVEMAGDPTVENMTGILLTRLWIELRGMMPDGRLKSITVRLYETPTCWASRTTSF